MKNKKKLLLAIAIFILMPFCADFGTSRSNEPQTALAQSNDEPGNRFYAVYDTTDDVNTLTFHYDSLHELYSINGNYYEITTDIKGLASWSYHSIRENVKKVVIDFSVGSFTGLTTTKYMFSNFKNANSIVGAENLNVSQVTDMSYMFECFGSNVLDFNSVPKVSLWNTKNVTNMAYMFNKYGLISQTLDLVPDTHMWNTANVKNMSSMFRNYGRDSKTLQVPPDVSSWLTPNVVDISYMFKSYGEKSVVLLNPPNVSRWSTVNVVDMIGTFSYYGSKSFVLESTPNVENWEVKNVKDIYYMFQFYGSMSTVLDFSLNLSKWNLINLDTKYLDPLYSSLIFPNAGKGALCWNVVIPESFNNTIKNTPTNWYVGDGTMFLEPDQGKYFTVMGTPLTYKGQSLSLGSDISINFYMYLTEEQALNGTMKFTIGDREITANVQKNDNGYYFCCPINTLEIATRIKAEFTYDNQIYRKYYSVEEYLKKVIDTGPFNKETSPYVTLCKAIANYGYFAQILLADLHEDIVLGENGYRQMNYLNTYFPITNSIKTALQKFTLTTNNGNVNIKRIGQSLSLDCKIGINLYIEVEEGYLLTKEDVSVSYDKEFALTQVADNEYRITIPNIELTNLGTAYTITIGEEEITTSALYYANKVVNGDYDENSKNAMVSLYECYSQSLEFVNN